MNQIFEYDVFMSFSVNDEALVRPIWQEMCLNGLRVFWSDAILKSKLGQSWFEVIQNSLERSRHFLLICSTSSMSSEWVKREYQAFFNHCYKPSQRLLVPLLMQGYKVTELPLFLRELEACRIEDQNSIKEITKIFGGVDIDELKRSIAIKNKENTNLRRELENTKLELDHYRQQQSILNSQIPAYTKKFQLLQSKLADQTRLTLEQESIIKNLKEQAQVKKPSTTDQHQEYNFHKSPRIKELIIGTIIGTIVGFVFIVYFNWNYPDSMLAISFCVFGGMVTGAIERIDRTGLIYMGSGVVLAASVFATIGYKDAEKTYILLGFMFGAPISAIVRVVIQKIKY